MEAELFMSQFKTALTEHESGWVNDVAGRLRLIQADTAQTESTQRCGLLQEEVERSLGAVSPANRTRLVEALLDRFPVAGNSAGTLAAATAPTPAAVSAPPVETADQILERLLSAVSQLSEDKRRDLARRLFDADFVRALRNELVVEVSEESCRALGLPEGQQPRMGRMVQLAVLLLEVLTRADVAALQSLGAVSPRSPLLKRSEDVRTSVARFLTGESDTLVGQMRMMRALLDALLDALRIGGREFGKQYVERFAPVAIQDVVIAEGGGRFMGPSIKERCWDRYCDLSRDVATADLVDRKIRDCLAAVVQKSIERSGSGGR